MATLRNIGRRLFETDPREFAPGLARIDALPPSPLGRAVLYAVISLIAATLAWTAFARLDIVAVAEGKLVPTGYLKVVQPAEQGIVQEIAVREGETVRAGQVLARMDPVPLEAEARALASDHLARRLALRRIEAQLAGQAMGRQHDDPPEAFAQAEAQHAANVRAHQNALAQERSVLERARHDLAAAVEVKAKLLQVLPHYREQELAFAKLARDGFAGKLLYTDKQRRSEERTS